MSDTFVVQHCRPECFPSEPLQIGITTECIDSCMYQGKNSLFVAYGPSGTGKSYTMFGDLEKSLPTVTNSSNNHSIKQGIVIQTIQSIFKKVDASSSDTVCIHLGVVEIYNEKVIDLQQKQRVESFAESMAVLANCIRQRSVCSTGLNNQSSRSHCIITLTIQNNESSCGIRRSGTICFVVRLSKHLYRIQQKHIAFVCLSSPDQLSSRRIWLAAKDPPKLIQAVSSC